MVLAQLLELHDTQGIYFTAILVGKIDACQLRMPRHCCVVTPALAANVFKHYTTQGPMVLAAATRHVLRRIHSDISAAS